MPLRRSWIAWTLAVLTVLLAVGDVVTTEYLLGHFPCEEGNPIIAWLMARFGPWWIVPKLFANVAISALLLVKWNYRLAKVGMAIYVSVYAYVVARHLVLIVQGA